MKTPPAALHDFPVVIEVPVAWGDMDAFQHVNNAMYFRYFESARIAYLQEIEFAVPASQGGIGPILGHTACKFLKPLTYPDTLSVGARTIDLRDDRFIMELHIYSQKLRKLAAAGSADMVSFDYHNGRKAALPAAVRAQIERLENRRF